MKNKNNMKKIINEDTLKFFSVDENTFKILKKENSDIIDVDFDGDVIVNNYVFRRLKRRWAA